MSKGRKTFVFKKKASSEIGFYLVKNHDKLLHITGTFTFLVIFSFLGWIVYNLTLVLQISKEVWDRHEDRQELALDLFSNLIGWALYFLWVLYL